MIRINANNKISFVNDTADGMGDTVAMQPQVLNLPDKAAYPVRESKKYN